MFKKTLLSWFLTFTTLVSFTVLLYWFGVFQKIVDYDYTRISFVIIAIFYGCSLYCGKTLLKMVWSGQNKLAGNIVDSSGNIIPKYKTKNPVEIGFFGGKVCMALGMVGTLIGMIDLFTGSNFNSINAANNFQSMITGISHSTGTALITTLVGLVASVGIDFQFLMLDKATDV